MNPAQYRATNTSKVLDCLSWALQQIQPPNYISGPVVVNRSHDPRIVKSDQISAYRASPCRITIKVADKRFMNETQSGRRGTIGMVKRYEQKLELICAQTLTKEMEDAGLMMDQIQAALVHDIMWGVFYAKPNFVVTGSVALNTSSPGWGYAPSCISPIITGVLAGPVLNHPNCIQVIQANYLYDEYPPIGNAGIL